MREELDPHGQPSSQAFNWDRRLDRGMDELVGVARGVLADGNFVIEEARFLLDWLYRNEPVRRDFFGKVLFDALREALSDDEMSAEEEDILVGLLLRFVGPLPEPSLDPSHSTDLPLDDPPPEIELDKRHFCFTGKFVFGTRRQCQSAVRSAGGFVHDYPIFATDYLVLGDLGSRDWIHSIYGRKIQRALEIRTQGNSLKFVAEQHWVCCIGGFERPSASIPPEVLDSSKNRSTLAPLAGKTIVVTGTLKNCSREQIEQLIEQHGGRATGSVSKKTTFVLAGEKPSKEKLAKATQLGVPVISEEQFEQMIRS
jgi:NAD-dependent DNA ligase